MWVGNPIANTELIGSYFEITTFLALSDTLIMLNTDDGSNPPKQTG